MNRITLTIIAGLLLPGTSAASWNLAPCSDEHVANWHTYERALRSAEPGSLHYLPKPFPKSSQEIIEDFVYQYRRTWDYASEVPSEQSSIYEGIQQNALRFEIVKVENWTTLRCGKREELAFYHLIRMFRGLDDSELGRAVLTDSGFIAEISTSTEKERTASADERNRVFPPLKDTLARVKSDFGIAGSTPQYVTVFSIPRMCEPYAPCVAFRAGRDTYVRSYRGDLFRVAASGRRVSTQRELKRPDKMTEALAALGLRVDEGVVSLGGSLWAVARKVERGQHP